MTPTKKLSMSVTEVMVIDTAASLKVSLIRSGTEACRDVRRQAPNMTKVSSMPMPNMRKGAARLIPIKGIPQYMIIPKAAIVARTAETTPNKPKTGLDLTQSVIIQVTIQNAIITPRLSEKNGITELVLFSSSLSMLREENLKISMFGAQS